MFTVSEKDIRPILRDYGIRAGDFTFRELERYRYEEEDPASRQVRLIVKADLGPGRSLVLRFRNEDDAPQEIIEAQSRFAALLHARGVETPKVYASGGFFARRYAIGGSDVVVTVEDFEDGEITLVDPKTAEETGELLARMHGIAEEADAHVPCEVLFDPLARNELFSFEAFDKHREKLLAIDSGLYHAVVRAHERLISVIRPFGDGPRYTVQGDISDCNLYRTRGGRLGVFDFNRCGDNLPYFDAVMQAIFEARLMDYPDGLNGRREEIILAAFLRGYHRVRPFTQAQKAAFPYLYALVSAFWLGDLKWNEDSLAHAVESGDDDAARAWMKEILRRASSLPPMPV